MCSFVGGTLLKCYGRYCLRSLGPTGTLYIPIFIIFSTPPSNFINLYYIAVCFYDLKCSYILFMLIRACKTEVTYIQVNGPIQNVSNLSIFQRECNCNLSIHTNTVWFPSKIPQQLVLIAFIWPQSHRKHSATAPDDQRFLLKNSDIERDANEWTIRQYFAGCLFFLSYFVHVKSVNIWPRRGSMRADWIDAGRPDKPASQPVRQPPSQPPPSTPTRPGQE